jgi:DNA-binding transcriptional regulator YhcF (GntR family)
MTPKERKILLLWFARRDELTQQELIANAKDTARRRDNNDRKGGRDVDAGRSLLDGLLAQIRNAMAVDDMKISTRNNGAILDVELQRAERAARELREGAKEKRKRSARLFLESHRRLIMGMRDKGMTFREIQKVLEKQKKRKVSTAMVHRIIQEWSLEKT